MKDLKLLVEEMLNKKDELVSKYSTYMSIRDSKPTREITKTGEDIEKTRIELLSIVCSIKLNYKDYLDIKFSYIDIKNPPVIKTFVATNFIDSITLNEVIEGVCNISSHIHDETAMYTWMREFRFYDNLLYS